MATTNFGNNQNNIFVVTNSSGYEKYNGMGGDDFYNVNPALTETITINDTTGVNSIILGITEIASTKFFKGGVQFNYSSGGTLTVLGNFSANPDLFKFIFGGGDNAFFPVVGGTPLTFTELVTVFGLNPTTVLATNTPIPGTTSGTLQADGTITGGGVVEAAIDMTPGGTYEATDGADIFVYEFSDFTGGSYGTLAMAGTDGTVTITGFDSTKDTIRFLDTDETPPTQAEFLAANRGYSVTPDGFANQTMVSLFPYYGGSGNDAAVASDIILQGVAIDEAAIKIQVA